jgi:hypothetical protein
VLYADTEGRRQLAREHAAALAADYPRREREGTRLEGWVLSSLALAVAIALALVLASAATADPGGPNVQQDVLVSCDDGTTFVGNGGTVTNRSHQAFVVDSTSIFVLSYVALTVDGQTFVIFDDAPGRTDLVTCTWTYGPYLGEGRGFFTPRA